MESRPAPHAPAPVADAVPPAAVGEVVRRIDHLHDDRLSEIVAMVDMLPSRGKADALIAPFRARLARLRPHRPMTLARLLYTPLDPVIVPTAHWDPEQPEVPRAALPAFTAIIHAGLASHVEKVQARVATEAQTAAGVLALGARLWPATGRLLQTAACPADWEASTTLRAEDFARVRDGVAQVLLRAVELMTLVGQCEPPRSPEPQQVRAVLEALAKGGLAGFRLGVVVLLRRCPSRQDIASMALAVGRQGDGTEAAALAGAMHVMNTAMSRQQEAGGRLHGEADAEPILPHELTAEIEGVAAMLRGLESMAALRPMSGLGQEVRRRRLALQEVCLGRFRACLEQSLLQPLAAGAAAEHDGAARLMLVAAELRELCQAIIRLGDRHGPERVVEAAAERIRTTLRGADPDGAVRLPLLKLLCGSPSP